MLLSLMTLSYYVYVVMDFFSQMKLFVDPEDLNVWENPQQIKSYHQSDVKPIQVEFRQPDPETPSPESKPSPEVPQRPHSRLGEPKSVQVEFQTTDLQPVDRPIQVEAKRSMSNLEIEVGPEIPKKPVRPYSHQSQRKNVSFVDEAPEVRD